MLELTINPPSRVQHQIRGQQQAEKLRLENEAAQKDNFLQSLPVEIIAEILSYTSLRTVLAVARSCKWLCTTLTSPDQSFIWKNARKRLSPSPPDPPYDVTEPAYASVIYSTGHCQRCGATHNPPLEFQHHAHLYTNGLGICRDVPFSLDLDLTPTYTLRNPEVIWLAKKIASDRRSDLDGSGKLYLDAAPHPADLILFPSLYRAGFTVRRAERDQRLKEWDTARDDPEAFSALLKKWSTRAERMGELQDHAKEWRSWVLRLRGSADYRREQLSRYLTMKFRCEPSDLARCRTFNTAITGCGKWGRICPDIDWKPRELHIQKELDKIKDIHDWRWAVHHGQSNNTTEQSNDRP